MSRAPRVKYFITVRRFDGESKHHAPNKREAIKFARYYARREEVRCVLVERIARLEVVQLLYPPRRKS